MCRSKVCFILIGHVWYVTRIFLRLLFILVCKIYPPVFPSFLPHPLPTLLLAPFFARSLTLVPRSLLLNHTETLATQANHPKIATGLCAFHICCRLNFLQPVPKDTVKPLLTGHQCIPRGSDLSSVKSQ